MKEKTNTGITKDKTKAPLWYTIEAIVGTLLEEAILVIIVLWVLPIFGIHMKWWWLAVLMAALAIIAYLTYRMGKGTFFVKRKAALEALVGSEGKVVKMLAPMGYVKVKGELWKATSAEGELKTGDEVIVAGVNGFKLIVRLKEDNGEQGPSFAEKENAV